MKTQILQLEPHDDVISTRDKMGWSQTGRVLLVWPKRGQVLNRRLDLVLLQRHSADLGTQLALVTRDPEVRYYARAINLPVFKNVRQAQEAHWKRARRPRRRARPSLAEKFLAAGAGKRTAAAGLLPDQGSPSAGPPALPEPAGAVQPPASELQAAGSAPLEAAAASLAVPAFNGRPSLRAASPRRVRAPHAPTRLQQVIRLFFFVLGLLAFLAFSALLVPSARLELTPATQAQEVSLKLRASQAVERVNLSGLVPIHVVSVVVEGRNELEPSGEAQVPVRQARGQVRFTNLTDHSVAIPAGTVVSDPGGKIKFATDRSDKIPAGPGQTLFVAITALAPGSAGNLAAGRINAIIGPLGVDLTASNPEPTHGGSDRLSPAPAAIDRSRLRVRLLPALQANARAEIKAALAPGDLLLTAEPQLVRTLEESYDPPDVQPTNLIRLHLRQEYQALVIRAADLRELAGAALDATLPPGFTPLADTLALENLGQPAPGPAGGFEWRLHASRQVRAQLSESQAVELARGLPPAQARQRLAEALPLAEPPEVILTPSWWPRLPMIPFRIAVNSTGKIDE